MDGECGHALRLWKGRRGKRTTMEIESASLSGTDPLQSVTCLSFGKGGLCGSLDFT